MYKLFVNFQFIFIVKDLENLQYYLYIPSVENSINKTSQNAYIRKCYIINAIFINMHMHAMIRFAK